MRLECWFDITDWTFGFSWWRYRLRKNLAIKLNFGPVKVDLLFGGYLN